MTEDDERLLGLVRTMFWARLSGLEEQIKKATAITPLVTRKARKVEDPVVARWLQNSHDPQYVKHRLQAIRVQAEHGSFSEAWLSLQNLERQGDQTWRLATAPVLTAGDRQISAGMRGNEMRSDNSFAALHGEAAQARADQIAAERPSLSWTAIRNIIAREFSVSADTIKKKLRNPKKVG